jgi:hypothetical protein
MDAGLDAEERQLVREGDGVRRAVCQAPRRTEVVTAVEQRRCRRDPRVVCQAQVPELERRTDQTIC